MYVVLRHKTKYTFTRYFGITDRPVNVSSWLEVPFLTTLLLVVLMELLDVSRISVIFFGVRQENVEIHRFI